MVTVPPSSEDVNLRVSPASNEIAWVPAGSVVSYEYVAPPLKSAAATAMGCAVPSMTTSTYAGALPW